MIAGRVPAGFTPTHVGAVIWLRGDLGLPDGALVKTWTDKSTNNHNATGTHGATFHANGGPNNQPYLSSPGTAGLQAVYAAKQPVERFIVCKWDTAYASGSVMLDGNPNNFERFYRPSATTLDMLGDNGSSVTGTTASSTSTSWTIYNLIYNGASSSMAAAGVVLASGAITNAGTGPAGLTLFNDGRNIIALAATGSIAEVFEMPFVLTALQRGLAYQYLETRYGLPGA